MRIAYLVNRYPKISHTFIRREILALERLGAEVVRIAIHGTADELVDPTDLDEFHKTQYLMANGVAGLAGPCLRTLLGGVRRFVPALGQAVNLGAKSDRGIVRHIGYFAEACALLRIAEAQKVSHVHAHFGTNAAAISLLAKLLGGPTYSLTIHGSEEFDRPEMLSLGAKIREAEFVATISSFGRSQVYRWSTGPNEWEKIHIVRCGLEPDYFSEEVAPITDRPAIVCVGRISAEKGPSMLVRAMHLLAQRGVDAELTLAGDGPQRGEIEALVMRLSLESKVRITGWVDNDTVRQHILESRALVVPSFAEGLPVVIMEAFALGRPVISSHLAGIPELVEDGASGWLVPAGDPEQLANALQEAVTAPPTRLQAMGEVGLARTRELHNSDTEARKLHELFALLHDVSSKAPLPS